jgi:hypothetical protein
MAATRKEQLMTPRKPNKIVRACLVGALVLVFAAPAGARVLPVDEGESPLAQHGWGAAATVAKQQRTDPLAQYGWGAAATYAKQQALAAVATTGQNDALAQYGAI